MENNIFSLENENLLEILKPYDWHAKKRNILEENIREPNEKKGFNIEGFPLEEIFIRELAQNALDAVEEKGFLGRFIDKLILWFINLFDFNND